MSRTVAPARCLLVVLGALVAGLSSGHPFVVALAVPFVAGPLLAWLRGRPAVPEASLLVSPGTVEEGEVVEATVVLLGRRDLDLVHLRLEAEGFEVLGAPLEWAVALRAGDRQVTSVPLRALSWGRRRVGPLTVSARGPGLLTALPEVAVPPVLVAVHPRPEHLGVSVPLPRALAAAGEHRSRRVGPGVEIEAVRPLAPGDRLRRVNWRATLRSTELQVTTSLAERSGPVLVVVDTAHDGGPMGSSTLDVAGRVALAVADRFLRLGDVVALAERGGPRRLLPGAPGSRQSERVREWLLDLRSPASWAGGHLSGSSGPRGWSRSARQGPAGTLVVAVSPFLDEQAVLELVSYRRRGSAVLAIDVLSGDAHPAAVDGTGELARRLFLLERRMNLDRLGDLGVPVVTLAEARASDAALAGLARRLQGAGSPRLVGR